MPLPDSFPPDTTFWDCNGLPVTGNDELGWSCTAWDSPEGRSFPCTTVDSDGVRVSEARFRELVAEELARRHAS